MIASTATRHRWEDRAGFAWGLGESVVFFVIPDVFLTLLAVRFGARRALRPAILATVGAVLGGMLVYSWASWHPSSAFGAMEALPGIDTTMVDMVRGDVAAHGNMALLAGPWQGRPYKLFAAASGELDLSLVGLVLLTIPGRLGRFLLSVSVAAYSRSLVAGRIPAHAMIVLWAGFWLLVYAGYWFG